jgi:hypothetical protein
MRKTTSWAGVITAYVLVIAVDAAANMVPIGGKNEGQVSELYSSLFTPAGYRRSAIYPMPRCFYVP